MITSKRGRAGCRPAEENQTAAKKRDKRLLQLESRKACAGKILSAGGVFRSDAIVTPAAKILREATI
jgi:hypothetical protein